MNHQNLPAGYTSRAATFTKNSTNIAAAIAATLAAAASMPTVAGVQSMTSDEMVDTYVKDSAVIVVPREGRKSEADRQRIIRALTISPGEPVITEAEEEAYREALQRYLEDDRKDSLTDAEEEFLRRALLLPVDELARVQPPAEFRPDIPQDRKSTRLN